MQRTICLSGASSELSANYFPPIFLEDGYDWECALITFETYYSIYNVRNNQFVVLGAQKFKIPDGNYEVSDLNQFINEKINQSTGAYTFKLVANSVTHTTQLSSNVTVELSDQLSKILGFGKKVNFDRNITHTSTHSIDILPLSLIQIEVNIINGAYFNNFRTHIIHSFFPSVPPGFRINEVPANLIYHPIKDTAIDNIKVRVTDQKGELIDFAGEEITIRLHIRKRE